MDFQAFYEGRAFDAYEYLGAHPQLDGGVVFRVYAPNAHGVSLIGEFNGWHEAPMNRTENAGFFELRISEALTGQMYKYVIYGQNGRTEHCDPYGFGMELRPASASIIRNIYDYNFRDAAWMQRRSRCFVAPLSIYEIHLGSFRRHEGVEPKSWYRYSEIADELIDYLRKYNFTHVEFMPLAEHPFDGSWGYQQTGFFAPTSRYGEARELMELVDRLHQAGFGAILDFVPAHFATDGYALSRFDGTDFYEYPNGEGLGNGWGTQNFNFSRGEVASFMQSAAAYWLEMYHFDGLRMDAISQMVYWMGDPARGVNDKGVAFLKNLNQGLHSRFPAVMLMAEDSTAFEGCTREVEAGGLGFDYKWDLGWMHDTLEYFSMPPKERANAQEKLTFSMHYFYKERHLLPLSHDDVVHGKRSIMDRFYGSYAEKFRQARAFYLYMLVHPGKKLNFMGNELAMLREWDERRELDEYLLKYPRHAAFSRFFTRLGEVYQAFLPLFEMDYSPKGFRWIAMGEDGGCVFGIQRVAIGRAASLLALFNFSDEERRYRLRSEREVRLVTELNTDWATFGGSTTEAWMEHVANAGEGLAITLPAYSGMLLSAR